MSKEIRYFGKGFNYGQDGPGNRLVYHLHGCNLVCPWCSNPEGMDARRECKSMTVDEVFDEIMRSRAMFFDGGGVTFSGGEPSLQSDSLISLLKMLKDAGVTTAIETNSTVSHLSGLLPYIDFPMLDFKHINPEKFRKVTGGKIDNVLENLRTAARTCPTLAVRIPLISGFNDDTDTVHRMAEFLKNINFSGMTLELLPYHEYGKEKWKKLGLEYSMQDAKISKEKLSEITEIYESYGIKLINT